MVPIADFRTRSEELLKKAAEMAALRGVDVALIIFSSTGELIEYSSSDMTGILTKYNERKASGQVPAAETKPGEERPSTSSQAPISTDNDPPQTTCSFTPANLSLDDIRRMGPLGEIFLKKKEDTSASN